MSRFCKVVPVMTEMDCTPIPNWVQLNMATSILVIPANVGVVLVKFEINVGGES